jgi:hypothetical protein
MSKRPIDTLFDFSLWRAADVAAVPRWLVRLMPPGGLPKLPVRVNYFRCAI